MKAISPLIAAVLLISVTMAIAGILAMWATTYTTGKVEELTQKGTTKCEGGTLNFPLPGYPKWDNGKIKAIIEARGTPLGNFTFVVVLGNDTAIYLKDTTSSSAPIGLPVTLVSEQTAYSKGDISKVQITTNCTDVKSLWSTLY